MAPESTVPPTTTTTTTATSTKHLFVIIHGFLGNPSHMAYVTEQVARVGADNVVVLNTKSNGYGSSMDGIDVCAERVLTEIEHELRRLKGVGVAIDRVSVIGYSMGGLVGRYLIGRMLQAHMFDTMTPMNFVTVATPHLGVRRPAKHVLNHVFNYLSSNVVSHSGEQMALSDAGHHGQPLLAYMAQKDTPFFRALGMFKKRLVYANSVNDRTVTYSTGSISAHNPYRANPKLGTPMEKFPHVLQQSASVWEDDDNANEIIEDINAVKTMADVVEDDLVPNDKPANVVTTQPTEEEQSQALLVKDKAAPPAPPAPPADTDYLTVAANIAKFSLIAIPMSLFVVPSVLVMGLTSRIRVLFTSVPKANAMAADAQPSSEPAPVDDHALRHMMVKNLNAVGWTKFDVRIDSIPNSHGPIVNRFNGFYRMYERIVDPMLHMIETQLEY